ncbi:MAG: hypothetical protein AAF676_16365 [Pseudomonadota bacterium]
MPWLCHRRTGHVPEEENQVRKEGYLRGKAPRLTAGNAGPSVKAYSGRLPGGETGYTFETTVEPMHRDYMGREGYIWREGMRGVLAVEGFEDEWVMIPVEVLSGEE